MREHAITIQKEPPYRFDSFNFQFHRARSATFATHSEPKQTCHRHRESEIQDPSETLARWGYRNRRAGGRLMTYQIAVLHERMWRSAIKATQNTRAIDGCGSAADQRGHRSALDASRYGEKTSTHSDHDGAFGGGGNRRWHNWLGQCSSGPPILVVQQSWLRPNLATAQT